MNFLSKALGLKKSIAARDWRQIRIFYKDLNYGQAYLNLLGDLLKPLAKRFGNLPIFFSRYGPLGMGEDPADCTIANLPADFRLDFGDGQPRHVSLRLRFVKNRGLERAVLEFLRLNQDKYWYSDIRNYDGVDGFGEPRVYAGNDSCAKYRRAALVAQILCANCRFVLETLGQQNGRWVFESNLNIPLAETSHWFCPHMVFNVIGNWDGSGFAATMAGRNAQGVSWNARI